MADVQPEKGWFKIANELAEAFSRMRLSSYEWQVLWCVMRHSYGIRGKKEAALSLSTIAELTTISRRNVSRSLKKLLEKNVLKGGRGSYGIQKDYEKWCLNRGPLKRHQSGVRIDTKIVSEQTPPMPLKPFNDNGFQERKDIKDSLKTSLSVEREKLERRIKQIFPQCLSIPQGIPNEKLFLFVYRISRGEIKANSIGSPVAYMKGMLDEDVTPFLEKIQRDSRVRAEHAEKTRTAREDMEKLREENSAEMSQLIRDFVAQLEGRHVVGV